MSGEAAWCVFEDMHTFSDEDNIVSMRINDQLDLPAVDLANRPPSLSVLLSCPKVTMLAVVEALWVIALLVLLLKSRDFNICFQ